MTLFLNIHEHVYAKEFSLGFFCESLQLCSKLALFGHKYINVLYFVD